MSKLKQLASGANEDHLLAQFWTRARVIRTVPAFSCRGFCSLDQSDDFFRKSRVNGQVVRLCRELSQELVLASGWLRFLVFPIAMVIFVAQNCMDLLIESEP